MITCLEELFLVWFGFLVGSNYQFAHFPTVSHAEFKQLFSGQKVKTDKNCPIKSRCFAVCNITAIALLLVS